MSRAANCDFHNPPRWIAGALAALLMIAQALAIAHVHQLAPNRRFEAQSQVVALDDGLCALCLFHINCPVSTSSLPSVARPALVAVAVVSTIANQLLSSAESCLFGRAPPVPL